MFKFKLGQKVKVQVLNVMTTGVVEERILKENVYGSKVVYGVNWNGDFSHRVSPTEEQLISYQKEDK
jgi:hypothetical protein